MTHRIFACHPAELVKHGIALGLVHPPPLPPPRKPRDKHYAMLTMRKWRAAFTAKGLTSEGTVRIYTPRPELRGLHGKAYKVAYHAMVAKRKDV